VSCPLCAHEYEAVYEDQRVAVALHEDWAVRGHAMVIWKAHVENISDLSADEFQELTRVYQRAERVLLDLTHSDRAIVLKLGLATPHLHIHIYPVSAALTRAEVMKMLDAQTSDRSSDTDRAAFVAEVRARLT
jgi:diadenosine tetraphosphate (Ap4A) HIT family hydrolase